MLPLDSSIAVAIKQKCGASFIYSMTVVEGQMPNKLLIYSTLGHVWSISPKSRGHTAYTMHERKHIS